MMKYLVLLSIIFASGVLGKHTRKIRKRSPTDQPSPGYCNKFNRGGTSRVHFYVCCNNCDESPNSCDRETYQSASLNNYCGTCGKDEGNGQLKETFKCGGCSGQADLKSKCSSPLRNVPGFCWVFVDCFQKHCRKRYKRSTAFPDKCFNLVCDPGETPENCPVDCCYQKNPGQCTWNSTCNPQCCDTPTCCITSRATTWRLCPFTLALLFAAFVS